MSELFISANITATGTARNELLQHAVYASFINSFKNRLGMG